MYLNISISIGFNLGVLSMTTAKLGFNTLFCVFIGVIAIVIPILSCIFLYKNLKSATLDEADIALL